MARKRLQDRFDARREELLRATWEFLVEQGYGRASLNRLLAHTATSKGAFYHYFESREALIGEVVDRKTREILVSIDEEVGGEATPALAKLEAFLGISPARPSATAALRSLMVQVDASRDRPLFDRLQRRAHELCVPLLEGIIEQGVAEGAFETPYPGESAEVIMEVGERALRKAIRLLQGDADDASAARGLERSAAATAHLVERVLGLAPGTLRHMQPADAEAIVARVRGGTSL